MRMPPIIINPAEIMDVAGIVSDMRSLDAYEARTSFGWNPFEATYFSLKASTRAWTAFHDGQPVAMFGINQPHLLAERSEIWMLGTRALNCLWLSVARAARLLIDYLLTYSPVLENWVHVSNGPALDLLAWLGACFYDAEPHGLYGERFIHFELRSR